MTPPTASGIVKGRLGLENSLECITVPMLEDLPLVDGRDMEDTTDLTTNGAIGRGRRCATH